MVECAPAVVKQHSSGGPFKPFFWLEWETTPSTFTALVVAFVLEQGPPPSPLVKSFQMSIRIPPTRRQPSNLETPPPRPPPLVPALASGYSDFGMIRFFRLLAQVLVLVIVALASTLISMRFAIHGREVAVPDFRGMAPSQAERVAFEHGLELARSDHFYSATIPAGRIVSQQPEPGTHVRRGWRVQAAESLGAQLIEIPTVLGMSPRAAEINIRRRGLEIGLSAELPTAASATEAIIAQTPSPGAQGVASPRVSLLYAAAPPESAYAMPDLTGMPLADATGLLTESGLKTVSVTTAISPASTDPFTMSDSRSMSPAVVGQSPAPGTRVTPATTVSLQVARS